MPYTGTADCKAPGCQHLKHEVCWAGQRPPVGILTFTCPDTQQLVKIDGGYIGLVEVTECQPDAVPLGRPAVR